MYEMKIKFVPKKKGILKNLPGWYDQNHHKYHRVN